MKLCSLREVSCYAAIYGVPLLFDLFCFRSNQCLSHCCVMNSIYARLRLFQEMEGLFLLIVPSSQAFHTTRIYYSLNDYSLPNT